MIEHTVSLADLLRDAIRLAEESSGDAVLRQLRGARMALDDAASCGPLQVDLFATRVLLRGLPIGLSRSEIAVVFALCLKEHGFSRDELAELLYPGMEYECAANRVKVNIHRARRRIGMTDAICFAAGRYVLGDNTHPELPQLEAQARMLRMHGIPDDVTRARLERTRQRALQVRPPFVLQWAWFESLERRIQDLGHDIGVILARDALNRNRYERAIEIAAELTQEDPLDEAGAELAIRGFLLAGDRAAAVLAYRRYASTVERELDTSPAELKMLIDE